MKKHGLKWYKDKLWDLVSKYVRLKYANEQGMVQCYTCLKWFHWKKIQCGHGFSGRGNAILFLEEILRPQCYADNCLNSGKLDIFTYKLREELGITRFEELWALKHTQRTFTIDELETMIEIYKQKIKEIKCVI